MTSLSFMAYVTTADALGYSQITDLALETVGGQTVLLATTRYDGVLSSWTINGNTMTRVDTAEYGDILTAGVEGSIQTVMVDGQVTVLTGGHDNGGLALHGLNSNGTLDAMTSLPNSTGYIKTFQHGITINAANGTQVVYGEAVERGGLSLILFNAAGVPFSKRIVQDTNQTYALHISDTATAQIGSKSFLFTVSEVENGVTSWALANDGMPTAADSMGVAEGLWVAAPTAVETATVAGKTFVVLGAATSNSISVMEVSATGQLTIRDHLLDTRDTRFGAITALETVQHNGQTYVIAGGADDGISVFLILPNGQLVHRATLEDTTTMGLANVSDIAAHSTTNGIDIFVASSSETGITRLQFNAGPTGQTLQAQGTGSTLTGGAGADILYGIGGDDRLFGGAGDDILSDGTGEDTLTGGAGADVFVLNFDGLTDVITDFTLGEDRIDLSGWPMVRSRSQLTMEMTTTGMRITYGDEVLIVQSVDGNPIDHRLLTDADLIGGNRVPQVILPGYPGPYTPDPELPGKFNAPTSQGADNFGYHGQTIADQFYYAPRFGRPNGMNYHGGKGFDTKRGGNKNDRLYGDEGKDTLFGGKGSDRLFGGAWNDRLIGGAGDDKIVGNMGDDQLFGGKGRDKLMGGAQKDALFGGASDDILSGQTYADRLFGGTGNDRLYGGAGHDRLSGGAGHDMLSGGAGIDRLFGDAGRDFLFGGAGADILSGMAGTDKLRGDGGNDRLFGGNDYDQIWGDAGRDKIWGGMGSDSLQGGSGNDKIWGEAGNDQIAGDGGVDRIWGDNGRDLLKGGDNDDSIWGGSGGDYIYGNDGADHLYGGSGADRIWGGTGSDWIYGGLYHDTLSGGAGADTLNGGTGDDLLYGGAKSDHLIGGGGDDILNGDAGYDLLEGGSGSDLLSGGAGNDPLYGGYGADQLTGGTGDDTLNGGYGADQFVFSAGADVVVDFEQGTDTIALDYTLWDGQLAVGDIMMLYATQDDTAVTFDFGGGNVLTIHGVTDYSTFAGSLEVF